MKWPKTASGKAIALPLGEKLEIKKVNFTIGGNAVNASVTFGRQGFRTGCFGKIGNDLAGRELRQRLKNESVEPFFAVSKEKPTAYSALLLSEDGERTILGHHGASDDLTLKDVPWNKLKSKWWYLSLAGESDKLLEPLLKFASKNKIKVAFNPSGHHIKHYRNRILAALKYLSFLVVNEIEAANLVGVSFSAKDGPASGWKKEAFRRLDKLTPGIVAVTYGPSGSIISDGEYLYKAGIFSEKKVADRTGAGDAFGSGFVAGLARFEVGSWKLEARNVQRVKRSSVQHQTFSPKAIEYAIRLATANAASVVEHVGATEGVLTRREFETDPRWRNLKIWATPLKK